MFHVGESELVKGVRVSSHFIIRTEISPSLAWPGFGALPLPWSVLLPTKSHPGSFRCQDGPCISSGFSTNRQASVQTGRLPSSPRWMPHHFFGQTHLTQRRKHLLSFASPMTRPVVPPKIAETVSRRWHQTLTQSHPQSAPRRTPEIGDHSTSKRDWTAVTSLHLTQRPLPNPLPPSPHHQRKEPSKNSATEKKEK